MEKVKDITAAEYRKTIEAAEPTNPETEADEDQEILALMFNDAVDKLTNGTFDIDQDLQFLKRMNGITGKAPFDLVITGFLIGVLEAMQFEEKIREAQRRG